MNRLFLWLPLLLVPGCLASGGEAPETFPRVRVSLAPRVEGTPTITETKSKLVADRWAVQRVQDGAKLTAVWAVDGRHAYAVGLGGLVLKTEDNGETWTQLDPPADDHLLSVHFLDPKWGWVLGRKAAYRTEDGGATWATVPVTAQLSELEQRLLAQASGDDRHFVRFSSYQRGLLALQGHLFATEDGGATWTDEPLPSLVKETPPPDSTFQPPHPVQPKDVSFRHIAARGDGWVLSCSPLGLIAKQNGVWRRLGEPSINAYSVSFPTAEVGFAVAAPILEAGSAFAGPFGNAGASLLSMQLFVTRDGGETWSPQESRHSSVSDAREAKRVKGRLPGNPTLFMLSAEEGWASNGQVGYTEDGGQTWRWGSPTGEAPGDLGMVLDARTGFLVKSHQNAIARLLP